MKANVSEDLYFKHLLDDGVLSVETNGSIYNNLKSKYLHLCLVGGYHRIHFNGHAIQAHRLVWIAFNDTIQENLQINHIDGNKINNHIDNLEVVSNAGNMQHAYDSGIAVVSTLQREGRKLRMLGKSNINAKLADNAVADIRQAYTAGILSRKEIRSKYNMSRRAVDDMLLGRSYKHVPYAIKKLKRGV